MLFKDLFLDMMEMNIPDDIAIYFKDQVKSDLQDFNNMRNFVNELEEKINTRNDKNR